MQRNCEAMRGDDGWVDATRDLPQLGEREGDLALCMSQSLRCAVILAQLLLDQSQLERQGDESLLRAVVQVALQELALLASGFDHPPAGPTKLDQASVQLRVQ